MLNNRSESSTRERAGRNAVNNRRSIVISLVDLESLHALIESSQSVRRHDQKRIRALSNELAMAEVIDGNSMPAKIVTMNSHVDITDLGTGDRHQYQVVFPRDADLSRNRISVLAPIGTALLGHQVGTEIECPILRGVRRFRIEQVRRVEASVEASAKAA
jgi:regulator of nucleoside diphosphate kinase